MNFADKQIRTLKTLSKKAAALILGFLIFALFVLSVTVVNIVNAANSEDTFNPRLTAPESGSKYYYSDINVFYKYGYGMPNCTAYAYGRAYEILNEEPKLSIYSAHYWYTDNIESGAYTYGQTPKIGAIACWTYSGGGHVAVVEKITDSTITFSNSAWDGDNFYLTTAKTSAKNPGSSGWTFQGYIYIGDFTPSEPTEEPTQNGDKYKVISDNGINLRSDANTSAKVLTAIPYGTEIIVTKTKEADSHTWGYTTYNGQAGWCALTYAQLIDQTQPATQQSTLIQPTTAPVASSVMQTSTVTEATEPTSQTLNENTDVTNISEPRKMGDVDLNGCINIRDATLIQKYILEKANLNDEQKLVADVNSDGKINISDAMAIQKFLLT